MSVDVLAFLFSMDKAVVTVDEFAACAPTAGAVALTVVVVAILDKTAEAPAAALADVVPSAAEVNVEASMESGAAE